MFSRSALIAARQHKRTLQVLGGKNWNALSSLAPTDHSEHTDAPVANQPPVDWRAKFRGRTPAQQRQAELLEQRPRFPTRRDRDTFYRGEELPNDITEFELDSVVKLACTLQGSRRLHGMIPKANMDVLEHVAEQFYNDPRPIGLLKNEHCGRVIRCLMEFGDHDIKWALGNLIKGNVWNLAMHKHGNFVVDGMLKLLHEQQRTELVAEVLNEQHDVLRCAKHWHGRFPLCNIIERGSLEERAQVAAALKGSIEMLATNLHGRRTIQTCLQWFEGSDRETLIAELLGVDEIKEDNLSVRSDAVVRLARHEHGTFVMQTLLETSLGDQEFLMTAMKGRVKELAMNPLSTYFLDKAIRCMDDWVLEELSTELATKSAGSSGVVECARDVSGSTAIRSFLQHGFATQRVRVAEMLCENVSSLAMHETGHTCVNCVVQGADHPEDIVFGSHSNAIEQHGPKEKAQHNDSGISVTPAAPVPRKDFNVVRDEFMKELLSSSDNVLKLSMNKHGAVVLERILEWGTHDEMITVFEGLKGSSKTLTKLARTEHGSKLLDSALRFLPPLERDELVDAMLFGHLATEEQVANETSAPNDASTVGEDGKKTTEISHWTSNPHASKFVRSILKGGTDEQVKAVVDSLKGKMRRLATDLETRAMVVDVLRFAGDTGELVLELFLSSDNAIFELAMHPVANKVIGYILENGLREHQIAIGDGMKGHVTKLAVNKDGSRLLQASFKVFGKDRIDDLLGELIVSARAGAQAVLAKEAELPTLPLGSPSPSADDVITQVEAVTESPVTPPLDTTSSPTETLARIETDPELPAGPINPSADETSDVAQDKKSSKVNKWPQDPFGALVRLMKSKYSNVLIQAMVRLGTDEHRDVIFAAMKGRMCDLAIHQNASFIVQGALQSVLDNRSESVGLMEELTDNTATIHELYKSKYGKFVLNMILENGSELDIYRIEKALAEMK